MTTIPSEYRDLRASELDDLPTLTQGHADDLKIDDGDGFRVWLCRCGIEDGMPFDNQVTVEHYDGRRWTNAEVYEARP